MPLDQIQAGLIGAGVGFIGGWWGNFLAHRRWKVDREDKQRGPYIEQKLRAYRESWKAIVQLEAKLSAGFTEKPTKEVEKFYRDFLTDLEEFKAYMVPADWDLASQYVDFLFRKARDTAELFEHHGNWQRNEYLETTHGPKISAEVLGMELERWDEDEEAVRVALRDRFQARVTAVAKGEP